MIRVELPPQWANDTSDNRRTIYRQMVLDLDVWCAHHRLPLPEVEFVIYATDTYVWESYASMFPWLIMAKPANRNGVLIPDNSFISHDMSGGEVRGLAAAALAHVTIGADGRPAGDVGEGALSRSGPVEPGSGSGTTTTTTTTPPTTTTTTPRPPPPPQTTTADNANNNSGSSGDLPARSLPPEPAYVWDRVKAQMAELVTVDPACKEPVLFFKGANTGADKYATRQHLMELQQRQREAAPGEEEEAEELAQNQSQSSSKSSSNKSSNKRLPLPLQIDLLGSKQPMFEWSRKRVVLDLPGHQPWSYRRKYLYLLRSVVFHVDTRVQYTADDVTEGWQLFFDHIFEPGKDYVALTQHAFDEGHPDFRNGTQRKLKELVDAIVKAYDGVCVCLCGGAGGRGGGWVGG